MEVKIAVLVDGEKKYADTGTPLSEIVSGEHPCGGHGKCGKCKVIATGALSPLSDAERSLLTEAELSRGVRLSCLTLALGDCTVERMGEKRGTRILTDATLPPITLAPAFSRYGVAIDIGTTTLAARLYDKKGNLLADSSCLNPQSEYGADVISRIESSINGKKALLSDAIRRAIDTMILELSQKAEIENCAIDGAVITGNTVMLSFLAGVDVTPLSRAPFRADRLFGEALLADTLGLVSLEKNTPVYLPPCIGAFVGADTSCAVLASELTKRKNALLVDVGTNGEMALWDGDALTVCSTAAGPAFEGVGISMGMRADLGAIDRVRIVDGELKTHVLGDIPPLGICGSGLVDAAASMLDLGLLDESGFLEDEPFVIEASVSLTQKDIRMLQLAKSAIAAGLVTLMQETNTAPADVPLFSIAGGFGRYLGLESAARIGLLPEALVGVARTVGNAALGGASMLLLDTTLREKIEVLAKGARLLDLSTNPIFMDSYTMGMMLSQI